MRKLGSKRKIDERGRVNIPKEYLRYAKLRIGDIVEFRQDGKKIIMIKEREEKQ